MSVTVRLYTMIKIGVSVGNCRYAYFLCLKVGKEGRKGTKRVIKSAYQNIRGAIQIKSNQN